MSRTTLRIAALLLAGAAALAAAGLAGVSPWWGLPLLPAVWFGLVAAGRAAHARLVARALARDAAQRKPSSASIATDAARRLRRVASGEPGFTAEGEPLPDLERAVLFPANPGDETAVHLDVLASSHASRVAIAAGLRVLLDESVEALGNPFHALFLDAETILPLVRRPLPRFFRRLRIQHAWVRERRLFDPSHAEEVLAIRLLQAGMPRVALTVLRSARPTRRRRSLRRLSRLLVVVRLQETGDLGFPMNALRVWAPAVVLVMGRRLRELIPGTPLVDAPARGAAALESSARHVPHLVRELERLSRDVPQLAPHVVTVLAAVLDRPADAIRKAIAKRALDVRPDPVLVPQLRGLALLSERRPSEAAGEFETALERAGDYTPAAFALAVARRRAGDPKKGAEALREHGILNPRNPDVPIYLARYLADSGDRVAARRVYREAIGKFPDALQIRVAYAMDLASWGDDGAAAEEFDFARRAQPGDARLALLAGRARLHAGRPREAVEPLEQAARHLRGGERAEAQYWLLSAFREQGLHDLAKPIADELVEGLGRGQEPLLDEIAEYLEERHDFRRARRAQNRARRLRGDRW